MSSYLICTLDISISMRPEDREQAKELIVEATLPVLEEMGYRYTREKLAEQLAPADYGVDDERTVGVNLYMEDMNYNLRDCDADFKVQELCEQIAEKLNGIPDVDGAVNIYADPDMSLERKTKSAKMIVGTPTKQHFVIFALFTPNQPLTLHGFYPQSSPLLAAFFAYYQ